MNKYVKIIIQDEAKNTLEHHYIREDKWGVPAGKIEDNETPQKAAARELLERSGFSIDISKLELVGEEGDFYVFRVEKADLIKIAEPGEKGGYETSIRWMQVY